LTASAQKTEYWRLLRGGGGLQPGPEINPYAAPTEAADGGYSFDSAGTWRLATLSQRWWGATLDGLFYVLTAIPAVVVASLVRDANEPKVAILIVVVLVTFVPLAIYQMVLTARTGQSLGKKIIKTRIVKLDGSAPGFMHGVFLRSWVTGLLGAIPYLGTLVSLADLLMIFRSDRRMLHDHIAGTNVIQAL
jgi:uncharacterized RDD family membrane protein YckC